MRFAGPSQEEVAAILADLIARFGPEAHYEVLHLVYVATDRRAQRKQELYRRAALEIDNSFAEARGRPRAKD